MRAFLHSLASLIVAAGSPAADKPNVVLFLIDDLGYSDLGCYGSKFHETPRLDALAASGVRLTDFYSANPVCSPTRAALQSGKAPHRLGITQWLNQPNVKHLPLEEITIAEAFAEAGYATGYMGKWHLGHEDRHHPRHQGYAWTKGVNKAGAPGSYYHPYKRNSKKGGVAWSDVPDLGDAGKDDYLTDVLTDHALGFLETNRSKPFFLCFGHYTIHTPIQPPRNGLVEKYQKKAKEMYGEAEAPVRPSKYGSGSRTRQDNADYAAMIENLDVNVGRVVDKLEELRLSEKTIIVFTSDNGGLCTLGAKRRQGPTCNLPLRNGKGWTYEGGTRICTLVAWPGTLKPAVVDTPGITMDLYPTLLDLAGLDARPEQHLDGLSLASALRGAPNDALNERFLGWIYPHHHGSGHRHTRAIRKGPWKLIYFEEDDEHELYHLGDDIGEQENLAAKNPEKVSAMRRQLDDWLKASGWQGDAGQ